MKTIIFAAAAVTTLATGAFAQDAFITQVGDGNSAANVQTIEGLFAYDNATRDGNLQVIQQVGNTASGTDLAAGNTAVQLTRGFSNQAFTYQTTANGRTTAGTNNSLIIQTEDAGTQFGNGYRATNNIAIHVQDQGRNVARALTSQTLQVGDENVAINWVENGDSNDFRGVVGGLSPTLAMPTLTQTATPGTVPTGSASVSNVIGSGVIAASSAVSN